MAIDCPASRNARRPRGLERDWLGLSYRPWLRFRAIEARGQFPILALSNLQPVGCERNGHSRPAQIVFCRVARKRIAAGSNAPNHQPPARRAKPRCRPPRPARPRSVIAHRKLDCARRAFGKSSSSNWGQTPGSAGGLAKFYRSGSRRAPGVGVYFVPPHPNPLPQEREGVGTVLKNSDIAVAAPASLSFVS